MYKTNPLNPMLSEHFDLFCLCNSETAQVKGIQNIPSDPAIIQNLSALCQNVLEPALHFFDLPIFITSGFRCPELNQAVGGRDDSQHVCGKAADILMGGLTNGHLARWLAENVEFDEIILEKFDPDSGNYGWVHVSYDGQNNRRKISTFDGKTYHDGFQVLKLAPSN